MLPRLNLADQLSAFLGVPTEDIFQLAVTKSKLYKLYEKPKKNGGTRKILHPCRELKALQYALCEIVLNWFSVHPIAYAYVFGKKSPLKASAELHAPFRYTIRIDFKDFFPSIKPVDLIGVVKEKFDLSPSDRLLLTQIMFYSGNLKIAGQPFLPIGAPTSPPVSNIVMRVLDNAFEAISKDLDQESSITRYADDLYFSTNEKGLCRSFYHEVDNLLRNTASPVLRINENKTLYLSRGTRRVVNGLFVTPKGEVSIGRERKIQIKTLIYKHSKQRLPDEDLKKAQGLLAFIQDCEPDFYNRLAQKYGEAFYSIKDAR
ncbi:retron St85 family RNA-directed DNA polymerase [Pseudodesulfovibrio pelocollis]|uniref:retron St85 family RNA-directed DNA polymerase n=1 Tax=Pseudodesulfovibrio pelocollis TaxID=3051432 RepID=UPI00255A8A03|nr:retron St85 family RNA-directed DNA polymerase [Pseudodesulfovibrio sp. SB368]